MQGDILISTSWFVNQNSRKPSTSLRVHPMGGQLEDPSNTALQKDLKSPTGTVSITAEADGRYTYCFSNEMSAMQDKIIRYIRCTCFHVSQCLSSLCQALMFMASSMSRTMVGFLILLNIYRGYYLGFRDDCSNRTRSTRSRRWVAGSQG